MAADGAHTRNIVLCYSPQSDILMLSIYAKIKS